MPFAASQARAEVFIPRSGLLGLYHPGEKYYEEGMQDVSEGLQEHSRVLSGSPGCSRAPDEDGASPVLVGTSTPRTPVRYFFFFSVIKRV